LKLRRRKAHRFTIGVTENENGTVRPRPLARAASDHNLDAGARSLREHRDSSPGAGPDSRFVVGHFCMPKRRKSARPAPASKKELREECEAARGSGVPTRRIPMKKQGLARKSQVALLKAKEADQKPNKIKRVMNPVFNGEKYQLLRGRPRATLHKDERASNEEMDALRTEVQEAKATGRQWVPVRVSGFGQCASLSIRASTNAVCLVFRTSAIRAPKKAVIGELDWESLPRLIYFVMFFGCRADDIMWADATLNAEEVYNIIFGKRGSSNAADLSSLSDTQQKLLKLFLWLSFNLEDHTSYRLPCPRPRDLADGTTQLTLTEQAELFKRHRKGGSEDDIDLLFEPFADDADPDLGNMPYEARAFFVDPQEPSEGHVATMAAMITETESATSLGYESESAGEGGGDECNDSEYEGDGFYIEEDPESPK
jgi:hypothetical protein